MTLPGAHDTARNATARYCPRHARLAPVVLPLEEAAQ